MQKKVVKGILKEIDKIIFGNCGRWISKGHIKNHRKILRLKYLCNSQECCRRNIQRFSRTKQKKKSRKISKHCIWIGTVLKWNLGRTGVSVKFCLLKNYFVKNLEQNVTDHSGEVRWSYTIISILAQYVPKTIEN